MANLIALTTGNFTSSSTWATVDATSELDSENSTTAISTSNLDSSTFVPTAITVDGVALKVSARAVSPSGTFTVTLRDSTTSTDVDHVTVNVSDLPATPAGCWVFFQFGGSHTLSGTDSYIIRVVCSVSSSQVTLYRNGTTNNWSRKLRTTTTQAPAANNHLVISNAFTAAGTSTAITVTMDNTAATTWGPSSVGTQGVVVGGNGTLTFGTTSSTNFIFQWRGPFLISGGGTVNIGTSGTRIPSSSTVTLTMDSVSSNDTYLKPDAGGTLNVYGANKTGWTYLTANASSSATALTVSDATGWQNNDKLAFSPTGTSRTEYETKLIASSSGVSGNSITLASGLTNAHTGTVPVRSFVLNLTRNVIIASKVGGGKGNIRIPAAGGTAHIECLQFDGQTMGTTGSNNRSIDLQMTTNTVVIKNCSNINSTINPGNNTQGMIYVSGGSANNLTLDGLVLYDWTDYMIVISAKTSGTITIQNCICMSANSSAGAGYQILSANSVVTNNVSISCGGGSISGFIFANSDGSAISMLTAANFSGNQCWYSALYGFDFGTTLANNAGNSMAVQNLIAARNTRSGILFDNYFRYALVTGCTLFGNGHSVPTQAGGISSLKPIGYLEVRDTLFAGDSTVGQSNGIISSNDNNNGGGSTIIRLYNCTFGVVSGTYIAHETADLNHIYPSQGNMQVYASKCNFASTTVFNNLTDSNQLLSDGLIDLASSFLRAQDYGQTAGDHRTMLPQGTIRIDSTLFNNAAPSEKLIPSSASYKLRSGVQVIPVLSGSSRTVSVYVRRSKLSSGDSADYNGNQPRLIVRRNDAVGIASDTVIVTGSAAIGTWELLSGVAIASPNEDGAIECYIDCDLGTTGFINCDDWSIS